MSIKEGDLPQSREALFSEINSVFKRISEDAKRPAAQARGSRLLANIEGSLDFADFLNAESKGKRLMRTLGDVACSLNIPETMALHSRITREEAPENPGDFFRTILGAKDWQLRTVGVSKAQIKQSEDFFKEYADATGFKTPTMWLGMRLVGIIVSEFKLRDKDSLEKFARGMKGGLPTNIKKMILLAYSASKAIEAYVHPATAELWDETLEAEDIIAFSHGIQLPSKLREYIQED